MAGLMSSGLKHSVKQVSVFPREHLTTAIIPHLCMCVCVCYENTHFLEPCLIQSAVVCNKCTS